MAQHDTSTELPADRGRESPWAQLRRRKIVQWGIVYAAGAWGFLQGLEYVTDTFHWPDRIQQFATLALLIGLPIVLVVAWYHGDRGEQRVSRTELVILTLLFLVGGGIFWRYDRANVESPEAARAGTDDRVAAADAAPAGATDPRPSIAVLPFENLSGNPDNAYFVSGMQDLVLTHLSKIRGLKVISRTSTERYASHPENLKTVGTELGVKTILEGSVQRAGDQVLINVQLIDVDTDAHLWAEVYDRKVADVFAVEMEVAKAIAGALQAKLSPTEAAAMAARPTANLAAYDLFLRAQYQHRLGSLNADRAALTEAVTLYRQAIAADPGFALAQAQLSIALSTMFWNGGTRDQRPEQLARQSEATLHEARRLQPDLPEASLAQAYVAYRLQLDFDTALSAFDAVLAARPSDVAAMYGRALVLRRMGRFEESIAALKEALDLSPRDSEMAGDLAWTLWMARRTTEAEDEFRRALELAPDSHLIARDVSRFRVSRRGDLDGAWALAQGGQPELVLQRVELLRLQRKYAEAQRLLASLPAGALQDADVAVQSQAYRAGVICFESTQRSEAEELLRQAKTELEAQLRSLPANYAYGQWVPMALADIEAMLGNEAVALQTVQQALQRLPVERDALNGARALGQAAQVYARLGRADLVMPLLEHVRLLPGADELISANLLKLDPVWDKVRDDPRFQAEIKRFAELDQR